MPCLDEIHTLFRRFLVKVDILGSRTKKNYQQIHSWMSLAGMSDLAAGEPSHSRGTWAAKSRIPAISPLERNHLSTQLLGRETIGSIQPHWADSAGNGAFALPRGNNGSPLSNL